MKVSVVVPTFNEVENVEELVDSLARCLVDFEPFEIIVVDDQSTDGTWALLAAMAQSRTYLKPLLRCGTPSLGAAIGDGLKTCKGEAVVVLDADFTHPPSEVPTLLSVGQYFDLVSASRFAQGGSLVDRRHYLASLVYNWALRIILRTQIQDNLGGFWTMRRSSLELLPASQIFFGYGDYFFRLLYLASANGLTIVEVPSSYQPRRHGTSKSRFSRLLFTYTGSAISFKSRHRWRR
jgi:dolichol-phosphate mannosyltransferase